MEKEKQNRKVHGIIYHGARGDSSDNIIGDNVYSSQSYLSRINTNARGCNPGLELINSECRATRQLTHY